MKGYSNHRQAINSIAKEFSLDPKKVDITIAGFFNQLRRELHFPNCVRIPHLGTLTPDMRSHKHLEKRREKFSKINLTKLRKS